MGKGCFKIRHIEGGADDCVFVNCLEEFLAGDGGSWVSGERFVTLEAGRRDE